MIKIEKDLWFNYLLYLSFIPLIIQGLSYLICKLYYPFIISVLIIGFVPIMLKKRKHKSILVLKSWSMLIIVYGIARLVLYGLVQIDEGVVPSVLFYQFDFWYHFMSLGYILLGYLCFSKRKKFVLKK